MRIQSKISEPPQLIDKQNCLKKKSGNAIMLGSNERQKYGELKYNPIFQNG